MEESSSPSTAMLRVNNVYPYELILEGLALIPVSHYCVGTAILLTLFLYNFLEWHLISDVLSGFRGQRVTLTYNPNSMFYQGVVSKCRVLHARYLVTPWLASPHLQTIFMNFFGYPPAFTYTRQTFRTPDGGTLALDWLLSSHVTGGAVNAETTIPKHDKTPLVLVIPGLASDSSSSYLKNLAYNTAKCGRNVVICNHRGLGGVSITSDYFYNFGWTEDIRVVIQHLHSEFPDAPLFVVGTSLGANVLVKYLGEEGENAPIAGAAAICSPWDLMLGGRFMHRKLIQRIYDRILTIGMQQYAELHKSHYSRLANWEGIIKSRRLLDYDRHATCHIGKFETPDAYYRSSSSASYVTKVAVPLLCISALDDPVCTIEAIPFDECRLNKNVVLATAEHGGHLAFFEGLTGSSLWWVRAVNEFLGVLHWSQHMHSQKKILSKILPLEQSADQGPFVNIVQDGLLAAVANELSTADAIEDSSDTHNQADEKSGQDKQLKELVSNDVPSVSQTHEPNSSSSDDVSGKATSLIKRSLDLLSRYPRISMWLLTYVAIATSWPLVGSALCFFFRRKIKNTPVSALQKR